MPNNLENEFRKYIDEHQEVSEVISFSEYLEKVKEHPTIASLAHKRIFDMIVSYGVETNEETGEVRYKFFEQELFGIEDSTKNIMEYFKGAATGSEVGRRLLLLYGPPSSGKSNLLTMIKRGLEKYSRTPEGALYGIEGCPMHEDPLNAVPKELRSQVAGDLGIRFEKEQELCPRCQYRLRSQFEGDFTKFRVKRIYMSETARIGIGTFSPADPKSQDVSELIGGINLAKIGEYGSESHPEAYKFDGELNVSNRGLVEFIEILKCVSPDSYVYSENGMLRIDEIVSTSDSRSQKISVNLRGQHGLDHASRLIYRGKGETRILRTSKNYEIEGAPDHRVLVLSEDGDILYKELRKISPRDKVCVSVKNGCWPKKAPLLKDYVTSRKLDTKRLTHSLAYALGYFVAKGSFNDILGTESLVVMDLIGTEYVAEDQVVPKIIREAPKSFVKSFLMAYFNELGTVASSISAVATSKELAKQIQLLLLNFGIVSNRDKIYNQESNKWDWKIEIDYENVYKFSKHIGFSIAKKQESLRHIVDHNHSICGTVSVTKKEESVLAKAPLQSGFYFDTVQSIDEGSSELWDFYVDKNHSYVANGLVNHNCDQKFLYVLLTATQEKQIKTPRYPLFYIDEAIISHSNESEYKDFVGNEKNEALIDRMIVNQVRYNLKVEEEIRIYEKLFLQGDFPEQVHVAPHTFRVAAIFAILSRLEDPKDAGLDKVKKMKLYNGEDVEGFSVKDVPRLKRESPREGMEGISPRYVVNRLITTAIRAPEGKDKSGNIRRYITPIEALRALKDGLVTSSKFKPEERNRFEQLLQLTKQEFDMIARNEVRKAFFVSFEDEAKILMENYLDHVEAYLENVVIEDPITHEEIPPDEKLMRSIETKIGVSESGKDTFRQEILRKVALASRRGEEFRYQDHARLREAIDKTLFEDKRDIIKMTISSRTAKDPEQLKRVNEVIDELCKNYGYTEESANELLKYVSSMIGREK